MLQGQELYLYHNDPNGCPTRLLDTDGKVVWSARYDALGNVGELPVDQVDNPLRMQGQYFDGETGLYYNRYRYFDPTICAFITQDPLGLSAGENTYAYAPNVLKWADPLGLSCKKTGKGHGLGDATTSPWLADPRVGVRSHLEEFRNGGSFVTSKSTYERYIKDADMIGYGDNSLYIARKDYMDKIFKEANGDISVLEKRLGFPDGHFSRGGGIVRIDVNNPLMHNARMPSGLEMGANEFFKSGGYTSGGVPEAVIDRIPNTDAVRTITEF
jgi:RHS repeat-associated protein